MHGSIFQILSSTNFCVLTLSVTQRGMYKYPTVISLSSPALPSAVQLWQTQFALIDQFFSVPFLPLLLEGICLALGGGSMHLTGISLSSCPVSSLSHGTPEHSVKIHGKELVGEEDFVAEVAQNFRL